MRCRLLVALSAVAGLALLAGYSASGSLDMRAVSETELADRASQSLDSLSPAHIESERPPKAIMRAAITNGSTTITAISPPIDGGLPVAFEGAYYNLSSTVMDHRTANAVLIEIDYNTTGTNETAIASEALPPVDQGALAPLFPERVPPRTDGADFGIGAIYTDAELNASVLAPTQQYDAIVYEGERYAINADGPRSVRVETYQYEATRVAASPSAYAAHLRERYAFTLSNLTDAERSVIDAAVEGGGYYADSTDDAAFESVLARFRAHTAIVETQGSGMWLVRYEGQLYLADLRYAAFLEE